MLRREPDAADRRPERRQVHRLDGPRGTDRGAYPHGEPAQLPARCTRPRDEASARDLGPRSSLRGARLARFGAFHRRLAQVHSIEDPSGPRKGDSSVGPAGFPWYRRLLLLRRETVLTEGSQTHTHGERPGRLERVKAEEGFGLIEMLMATTLFLCVSAPLVGVLLASVAQQKLSRERTLAAQAAQ